MKLSFSRLIALLLAVAIAQSLLCCTVAFDLSSLQGQCADDEKECYGHCVPNNDPATGCNESDCAPCFAIHGTTGCDENNQCIITDCLPPWDDCDEKPKNGCETNLATDPEHCTECNKPACSKDLPNAAQACIAAPTLETTCGIASCVPGFGNCDSSIDNGCETYLLTDHSHCGNCSHPCNATEQCTNGHCSEVASIGP